MTEPLGSLFERLVDLMARLRSPQGCPWDREQTPATLKAYLIEEAHEVLEALEQEDAGHLAEELGDLLFQVVFHCQIAAERGDFTMRDVLARLVTKMVSRHPHVFGDATVETPQEALAQWEALKHREARAEGRPRSVIDGVPRAMPGLLRAQRVQSKAARIGFDWPDAASAWSKVREEIDEAAAAIRDGDRQRLTDELGDVLFSIVNVARLSGIDAEDALRGAIDKFRRRFVAMEEALLAQGKSVEDVAPDELERSWDAAKARERGGSAGARRNSP